MAQDTASHISDTSNWPTLTEAAVRLGSNERTIRRWIDGGQLRAASRPIPGRKPATIVNPDDIERVRAERSQAVVVQDAPSGSNDPADAAAPALALNGGALQKFLQLFAAIQSARAIEPKPWLTLKAAVEYSGLPAHYLVAQARAGMLRAVNVGTGKNEFWRFNREGLAK